MRRDDVRIGLVVTGQDPCQATCSFTGSDLEAVLREPGAQRIEPGKIESQGYDDKSFQVFFATESYGICFCFSQPT